MDFLFHSLQSVRFVFSRLIGMPFAPHEMDLDALYNEVLLLPDDDPTKIPRLKGLNDTFLRIWDNPTEITRVISTLTKAIRLASDVHRPAIQSNLGGLFAHRFVISRDIADIEEGVAICKDALRRTPEGHQDIGFVLNNLGNSFGIRFRQYKDDRDLIKAVDAFVEAVRLLPDKDQGKPLVLANLGMSFGARFERFGDVADLDKAIETYDEAVRRIADDRHEKPSLLSGLEMHFECVSNASGMSQTSTSLSRHKAKLR